MESNRLIRLVGFAVIGLAVAAVLRHVLMTRSRGDMQSYLHQTPPEFPAGGTWINTDGPLDLAGLRGRVVLLEFSFLA
jgi:hypothetical protein